MLLQGSGAKGQAWQDMNLSGAWLNRWVHYAPPPNRVRQGQPFLYTEYVAKLRTSVRESIAREPRRMQQGGALEHLHMVVLTPMTRAGAVIESDGVAQMMTSKRHWLAGSGSGWREIRGGADPTSVDEFFYHQSDWDPI
jgi:hypothetical protein